MNYIRAVEELKNLREQIIIGDTNSDIYYQPWKRYLSTFIKYRVKVEKSLVLRSRGNFYNDYTDIDLDFDLEDVDYFLNKYECKAKEQLYNEKKRALEREIKHAETAAQRIESSTKKLKELEREIC